MKQHHRAKTVVDIETGRKFPSAVKAAKVVKMSPQHLRNQLNGTLENKTKLKYR